ncbi:MAG: hypothetical protein ACXVGR_07020 [Mycobacteriaceae bacterium]
MSTDRFTEQYRQLVSDPEIRAALLADPKAALVTHFGEIVEGDYRIEVIEQRSDTITALIPLPQSRGPIPRRDSHRSQAESSTSSTAPVSVGT